MATLSEDNFSTLMADREDQRELVRTRKLPHIERKVRKKEFSEPEEGWYVLDDTRIRDVKLAKTKPDAEQFEDRLWVLLSKMGFKYLSKDRNFRVQYDTSQGASQQLDVLAVDDECAIIVECKSSDSKTPKPVNFKTEIESLGGKKAGLHREICDRFNNPDIKIAYVLATKNYIISDADKSRLDTFKIRHISESV